MKKNHAGFWVGLAILFIAAIYSVIVFLLKPSFDLSAWILYGFTMVAFLFVAIQAIASARSGAAVIMDTTLGIVSAVYFMLQFIFGGIVCMCFADLEIVPVLVGEIILLAAYLAITFLIYGAQSHMAAQDSRDLNTVQKMGRFESDVRGMADHQDDATLKQALNGLAEEIHYSDVASMPVLADVEGRIERNIANLHDELMEEGADVQKRIETIRRLLRERDREAMMAKQSQQ